MSASTAPFCVEMRDLLRRRLSEVVAGRGRRYALLDFPDYDNVGDTAIWLGEIATLRAVMGGPPAYTARVGDYSADELRRTTAGGVVFIQGGGNFGDLYPWFQAFRLRLLSELPDFQIVQLPCSIFFRDKAALAETAAAVARHGDFTLLVRERASLERAETDLKLSAVLTPDAAFGLGPQRRPRRRVDRPVFSLLRDDGEAADPRMRRAVDGAADWGAHPDIERWAQNRARRRAVLTLRLSKQARRLLFYNAQAERRLRRGFELLGSGRKVVSDRLHAHIMAILLDIPNVAVDNLTGKTGDTWRTWTERCPNTLYATSVQEGLDLLPLL